MSDWHTCLCGHAGVTHAANGPCLSGATGEWCDCAEFAPEVAS